MVCAAHIIARDTPADMLWQLRLLVAESQRIVCVEKLPEHLPGNLSVETISSRQLASTAEGADLIHAWSPRAARDANRLDLPVVLSLPAVADSKPTEGLDRSILARAKKGQLLITVPTDSAKSAMTGAGLDCRAVCVLAPSARAPANGPARRQRTRQNLGIGADDILLVAPAEMTAFAGQRFACWAHAILRVMEVNVKLALPGGGPNARQVHAFAQTTGWADDIFLTGWGFELDDLLTAGDIALLLAERDEGLASIAAAMAAGLAIVATTTPDLTWAADNGQAAMLVKPANPRSAASAILQLIENGSLADNFRRSAADRAAELFDPQRSRDRLEHIYSLLVKPATAC